ncbi:MAG: protein kinase, partial [Thermoguttaceae bacterium]|nr:protein kinase [Thermoguttaceae bacterium]
LSLGRPVALKILKDELARDETYMKRFLQEARAAARLEHPNIVRVYEVGVATLGGGLQRDFDVETLGGDGGESGALNGGAKKKKRRFFGERRRRRRGAKAKTYRFIAQEYVDGMSLQRFLRRGAKASIAQTFSALEQIAAALKRAADAGVVHRDVKPENVLLDANGTIKVVDFGLARLDGNVGATSATLTRTGFAMGTPLYMSPEQARGGKIDFRSDIYSLGIVAYRMLTGVAPFNGDAPLAVILKHLNERPRPIEELRPDAPPALIALIGRMIEKKPSDRPESPNALLDALRTARREFERSEAGASGASSESTQTPFESATLDGGGRENEREPENAVASTGFFRTDDERAAFERALETTNLSQVWQTNGAKLRTMRAEAAKRWTRRGVALAGAAFVGAFLCGAAATAARNRWIAAQSTEPPSTIRRFDSVEEQWVFALHTGTVDAWRSVGEYFPNDAYWASRAERQLALAYLDEDAVAEAKAIFERIAANPGAGRDADPFGLAGLAWCAALDGDMNAAVATISELRTANANGYDRLTEFALAKTEEIVRRQTEVAGPRELGGGRGGAGNERRSENAGGPNGKQGNVGQPGPGWPDSNGKPGEVDRPGPGWPDSSGKPGGVGQPGPGFGGSDGKQGRVGQPGPGFGGSDGKQGRVGQPGPGWPDSNGKAGEVGQPGPGWPDSNGKPGGVGQPGPSWPESSGKPGDVGQPKPDFGWSERDAEAWSRFSFEDAWSRWNERAAFEEFWSGTFDAEPSSTAPEPSEALVKAEEVGTDGEPTDVGATEPCVASACDSVCAEPCVASTCDSVCAEPCVVEPCGDCGDLKRRATCESSI